MSKKPTKQAIETMKQQVIKDLAVLELALHPPTPEVAEATASVHSFVAIALRVFAETNPSKLRDAMRTTEIMARMDGKQVFE